jgi:hypothetical protein
VLGGHVVSGPGQLVAWTGVRRQRRGQPGGGVYDAEVQVFG